MPIKSNTSEIIPFLRSFSPYNEPAIEENIENMFSYKIVPAAQRTLVEYLVGSTNKLVASLETSNLTENASLQVEILYNKDLFDIPTETTSITPSGRTSVKTILLPLQNKTFNILLTPLVTNTTVALSTLLSEIELAVSLIPMGDIVRKSNKSPIQKITLPSVIQLV